MNLLDVRDLKVSFPTADGIVQAVRGVSFRVEPGRTLGIVGESGSGKSVSVQTLMGLTLGADVDGEAMFDGQDLLTMGEREMRRVRGAQIAMIFQDPLSSLHPHYRVGWQVIEMIREHQPDMSKAEARKRAIEMLGLVGIPQPDRRVDDYPHQFSGGMRQRAMIAMALSLHPKLIIADEPTTALDATVQAQILDLMRRLQNEFDTALIMITHDLGVIADMADDVLVMYGGKAAEEADRRTLYYRPHHPYTKGLLESVPGASGAKGSRLKPIPGQPPSLINLPQGCVFNPRCEYVMSRCRSESPPLHAVDTDESGADGTHLSACWLPKTAIGLSLEAEEQRRALVAEDLGGQAGAPAAAAAPKVDTSKGGASKAFAEPNEEGTE